MQSNGLSLGAMSRAAMSTTSIANHEARVARSSQPTISDDPRLHMTIDELRATMPAGGEPYRPDRSAAEAKRLRRAARYGDVPVVINRRAPTKKKRKSRAKSSN